MTCLTALAPASAGAATYSARLRFVPGQATAVAGYRVYVQPVGAPPVAPRDVGAPAVDADGLVTVVLTGLEVRETYDIAASSYNVDGAESQRSNQMRIGYADVASYVDSDGDRLPDATEDLNLNTVLDLGETDPTDPDTDDDGVRDRKDRCQRTSDGAHVDAAGCPRCTRAQHCYDGDPCTLDICDNGSCRFEPAPDATPCSDGLFCNGLETCRAGVCTNGSPPDCNDGSACTTDSCDELRGRCVHDGLEDCCNSDDDCIGTDACTMNSRCVAGTCVSDARACEGGSACRRATCDPLDGCRVADVPDAMPCGASDPCSDTAVCYRHSCRATGPHRLRVPRLAMRAGNGSQRLTARLVGMRGTSLDPAAMGIRFELLDANGARLYRADIPPDRFLPTRGGRVLTLAPDPAGSQAATVGIDHFAIKQRRQRTRISIRATLPALDGAPRTLVIRAGNACLSAIELRCKEGTGGLRCR